MKETSIYDYYAFGYNYRLWRSGFEGKSVKDAISSVNDFRKNIVELELQVTSKVISPLDDIVEELKKLDQSEEISEGHAEKINTIIIGADATLDAELQLKMVLALTPKRFNLDMLLKDPKGLLANSCWNSLTRTAQLDFTAATRCIALNHATAAAFHLMRCVEEMVKQLYFHYVKTKRLKKPMWAPMLDKLKNKNQPKPKKELIDHLDMIRNNYRNPTQHPEKFYTIDEAQDLLHSSIVAVNKICDELAT